MNMCCTRSNNIKNELSTRQSERPPQATGVSVASSDARPDTSGDLSVSNTRTNVNEGNVYFGQICRYPLTFGVFLYTRAVCLFLAV